MHDLHWMARFGVANVIVVGVRLLAETPLIPLGTRHAIVGIVAVARVLLWAAC